jgi:hypothetical protein
MSTALVPATLAAIPTAGVAVWTGLIGLALAMGIGRFAFTPWPMTVSLFKGGLLLPSLLAALALAASSLTLGLTARASGVTV